MPSQDHSTAGRREKAVLCCGFEKNAMVGAWHGTAWQRNGMNAAWERHAMCESALKPLVRDSDGSSPPSTEGKMGRVVPLLLYKSSRSSAYLRLETA